MGKKQKLYAISNIFRKNSKSLIICNIKSARNVFLIDSSQLPNKIYPSFHF